MLKGLERDAPFEISPDAQVNIKDVVASVMLSTSLSAYTEDHPKKLVMVWFHRSKAAYLNH